MTAAPQQAVVLVVVPARAVVPAAAQHRPPRQPITKLHKASINIAASLPEQQWINTIKNTSTNGFDSTLDAMLNSDAFYTRLKRIYAPLFYTGATPNAAYPRNFDSGNRDWAGEVFEGDLEKRCEKTDKHLWLRKRFALPTKRGTYGHFCLIRRVVFRSSGL